MTVHGLDSADSAIASAWSNLTSVNASMFTLNSPLYNAAVEFNAVGPNYAGDCFGELAYQLFIVFATMITVNNLIELASPLITKVLQNRAQTKQPKADTSPLGEAKTRDAEAPAPASGPENAKLATITDTSKQSDAENEAEYPQYDGTFQDYDELIIQFGFVVLFVVVFPAAPVLALINNFIEFPLDAEKILGLTRRPHPKGAYDMGTWFNLLDGLAWLMVISNTAIIIFESSHFSDLLSGVDQWIAFLVVEHILIGIKLLIQFFVPDVPEEVEERIARQQIIRHTLVDPIYS